MVSHVERGACSRIQLIGWELSRGLIVNNNDSIESAEFMHGFFFVSLLMPHDGFNVLHVGAGMVYKSIWSSLKEISFNLNQLFHNLAAVKHTPCLCCLCVMDEPQGRKK